MPFGMRLTLRQHSPAPTCLPSQNPAGSKHVPLTRQPVFIHPHPHPRPRPSHLRLPKPLSPPIATRWILACTPHCSPPTANFSRTRPDRFRNEHSSRGFLYAPPCSTTTFAHPCHTGGHLIPIRIKSKPKMTGRFRGMSRGTANPTTD